MSRASDRRREQAAALAPVPGNERPNVPPRPIDEANRCPGRLGHEHDFSMTGKGPHGFADDRGARVVRCWYCVALSPFSQRRIAAWHEQQRVGPVPAHEET